MDQRAFPVNLVYWVVLFLVFVVSCATQEELRKAKAEPGLENLVEVQPATPSAPFKQKKPAPLLELTLPQLDLVPKKPPAKGPRFSLSAEDVDVKTILLALSKEIDQSIMIDPTISKKVTLNLSRVTLGEMLDHVLTPLHLQYEIEGEFIQVTPLEMQTRVFHLNYLISRRQGSGKLQASVGTPLRTSAVPGNSSSQIFSSEETDLWQEIAFGLRQMIATQIPAVPLNNNVSGGKALESGKGNDLVTAGYVSINKQAGIIVVKAFPEDLLRVAEYLEEVEGSVQRQVFIQAHIIRVALKDEYKTGIDWNQISSLSIPRPGEDPSSGDGSGQAHGFLNGEAQLDEMLEMLSHQGDVSILASPRIAALNNQRAVIKVGTEDSIFVPDTTTSTNETRTGFISQPVDLGIVLDVVPQINVNGNVMMSVFTSVRRKAGERQSPDGQYEVPVVDVRESNNVVLARNGQTVVIGGMRKTQKQPVQGGTAPLLKMPILGNLFHQDRTGYEKSELVILITPEIMVGEAIDDRWRIEEKRLKQFGFNRHKH
jgi:MSHA biogenesis protein MshL